MRSWTGSFVWWLGAAQCVFWGVLYYGFPVWQLPLQARLGVPMAVIAAAYSSALLVAALLAPRVGRGFDRGHGAALFRAGLVTAVAGLLLLATGQSVSSLFLGWLGIGVGMALTLYESAFALVHHAIAEPARRLRGLAAVTVMGGLASTIFLPLLGGLLDRWGLQASLMGGALAVLAAAWVLERRVLPGLPAPASSASPPPPAPEYGGGSGGGVTALAAVFTSGTIAGMALVTLVVPMLVARGVGLTAAAAVLGALGLAQLPGRLWLLRGGGMPSATVLTAWPMLLQATGLVVSAVAGSVGIAAVGIALFGLGAGMHTLARPWIVQQRFGVEAGYRNGQVAMAQGIGRALAPVAAVTGAALVGAHWVLVGMALFLLGLLPLALKVSKTGVRSPFQARRRRSSITAVTRAPVKKTRAA